MTKLSKNGPKRMKVKRNSKKTQISYVVCLSSSISTAIQALGRYMPCPLYLTILGQALGTSLSHSLPITSPACTPCTQEISILLTKHTHSRSLFCIFPGSSDRKQMLFHDPAAGFREISSDLALFISTNNGTHTSKNNLL